MRLRLWAGTALVALLAGCATIPGSGPVNVGITSAPEEGSFLPLAEGPKDGADPQAIIQGFIAALPSGFDTDFSVAREYLTPEASRGWNPEASVMVFGSGSLIPTVDQTGTSAVLPVPVTATIDADGRLVEAPDGAETTLDFSLTQGADGQWRISELADGSLLAETFFESLFRRVGLVFATTDGSTQVAETRWFPETNAATRAASELVVGPSPWLADAVSTGFTAAASLEVDSVVVTDGVAAVRLASDAASSASEVELGLAQLQATLTALPDVTSVDVTIGGVPVEAGSASILASAQVPSELAAAIVGSRLGLWDGTSLRVTPDSAGALPASATGLAQSYSGSQTALIVDGTQLVVTSALSVGMSGLVPSDSTSADPSTPMELETIATGASLVAPSYDVDGWLWTADAGGGALSAYPVDGISGEAVQLEAEWLQARRIQALAVSRDGARVLVASTVAGQPVMEVAGIVRDASGTPVALTEPLQVGVSAGASTAVTWIDSSTVAALGSRVDGGATPLWIATVGGLTEASTAASDATALTARSGTTSLTVLSAEAGALARSGTGWTPVVAGVTDLAYAG
ncbi:LpqB family beta-propeller domain-containing protein [Demequina capsici]|uniref:LpqB family beta-propeller domain-containing protein n=1 Tax=Demequina capsici TaxID=3075620 RepID=A0AA96J9U0_9MICO|nr:LpqB family beta-propeller domain-containing protein [Demequina sp. OYTSA14]WNM23866.1 LpqB family beta-propeller domain-containing protein [Demequina sp. OYTSA14]